MLAKPLLLHVLARGRGLHAARRGRRAWCRGSRAAPTAPTLRSPTRTRVRRRAARRRRRGDRRGRCAAPPHPARRRRVYMRSSACCCPTTAGNVTEMPKPWWKPSLAKLQLKRVSGDGDTEVGRRARGRVPRPRRRPAPRRRSACGWRRGAPPPRRGVVVLSSRSLPLRSAPAQKFLPSEQSTRARHSGSSSRPRMASASSVDHRDVEPVVRWAVDLDRRDVVGEIDGDGLLRSSSADATACRSPCLGRALPRDLTKP